MKARKAYLLTSDQFEVINELSESLAASKSLISVAQSLSPDRCPAETMSDYLSALCHLLDRTEMLFTEAASKLA